MDDLKARLLAPRADTDSGMPEDDVPVPGIGVVRVRGLSRGEQLRAVKQGDIDAQGNVDITRVAAIEARMVATALVSPTMTVSEIHQWQEVAGSGELEPVTRKITELSGMAEGAAKEVVKSFRVGSDA